MNELEKIIPNLLEATKSNTDAITAMAQVLKVYKEQQDIIWKTMTETLQGMAETLKKKEENG